TPSCVKGFKTLIHAWECVVSRRTVVLKPLALVWVLSGETQDQLTERALERRSSCFPMWVRPAARDKLAVPAQHRVRFDCEVRPSRPIAQEVTRGSESTYTRSQ